MVSPLLIVIDTCGAMYVAWSVMLEHANVVPLFIGFAIGAAINVTLRIVRRRHDHI